MWTPELPCRILNETRKEVKITGWTSSTTNSDSQGEQMVLSSLMPATVLEIAFIVKRCKLKKKLTQALVWITLPWKMVIGFQKRKKTISRCWVTIVKGTRLAASKLFRSSNYLKMQQASRGHCLLKVLTCGTQVWDSSKMKRLFNVKIITSRLNSKLGNVTYRTLNQRTNSFFLPFYHLCFLHYFKRRFD